MISRNVIARLIVATLGLAVVLGWYHRQDVLHTEVVGKEILRFHSDLGRPGQDLERTFDLKHPYRFYGVRVQFPLNPLRWSDTPEGREEKLKVHSQLKLKLQVTISNGERMVLDETITPDDLLSVNNVNYNASLRDEVGKLFKFSKGDPSRFKMTFRVLSGETHPYFRVVQVRILGDCLKGCPADDREEFRWMILFFMALLGVSVAELAVRAPRQLPRPRSRQETLFAYVMIILAISLSIIAICLGIRYM